MTTTTNTRPTESWSAWLESLDTLQAERAEITTADPADRLKHAENRIRHLCGIAWRSVEFPLNLDHAATRGDEDAYNVRAVIRHEEGDHAAAARYLLNLIHRAQRATNWPEQSAERKALAGDIAREFADLLPMAVEAANELDEAEQTRAAVDERITDLQAQAPQATPDSVAALHKELEAAQDERNRIAQAIANLTADDSALSLAREAEQHAQERLEEAEALLAMGEIKDTEIKSAKATATKASKALEEAQGDHRRQEAARRGLARKLEAAESRQEAIARVYRSALSALRHRELEAEEEGLLADVERIKSRVGKLAAIHRDLEEAEPGSSYRGTTVEIKLPTLYHHADHGTVEIEG